MKRAVVRYKAKDILIPEDYIAVFNDADCSVMVVPSVGIRFNDLIKNTCSSSQSLRGRILMLGLRADSDFVSCDGYVLEVGNTSIAITATEYELFVNDVSIRIDTLDIQLS